MIGVRIMKRGFTLIELLAVVVVLSIIALITIPTIALTIEAITVILIWVLKSIIFTSLVNCIEEKAPIIILNDDTLVRTTSSSRPKNLAINGEHKKITK